MWTDFCTSSDEKIFCGDGFGRGRSSVGQVGMGMNFVDRQGWG